MMRKDTLVSIIVPVYGTEAYLPSCIESLCGQSHKNLQIILIDDQSPDRCPEICDEFAKKDSRLLVIHQKNKGVSGARNTGLLHAIGEYIMFVDSDDVLYPSAVEILLRDAREHGADIVSAVKRTVDKNGNISTACEDENCKVFREESALLLSLAGNQNTNSACAKLMKTDFIREIYFEEGKNLQEDGFFIFQCYMRNPILVQHNIAVYQYNIRGGSASRQPFSDKHLSLLYFCERKKALVKELCPKYMEQAFNMEVRTNLQVLDLLCSTVEDKYNTLQKQCIDTICNLYLYHKPINIHHKRLAWIAAHGLYPIYKKMVRMKYYR